MDDLICYFNGQYIKESEVELTLYDAALMEGMVYTARRTFNHVPFFWEEHTEALFRSLRALRIDPGLTPEEMHDINLEVFRRNEKYSDEMFVTANSYSIAPVARFNETLLEDPIPGPITQQLLSAFSQMVGVDIVKRVMRYVQNKARAGN